MKKHKKNLPWEKPVGRRLKLGFKPFCHGKSAGAISVGKLKIAAFTTANLKIGVNT